MFVIRVTQLARELGVHRNTVANWIKSGKLKASPTVGQKYLIAKGDLSEFCRNAGISERLIETLAQSNAYAVPISQPVQPSTLSNSNRSEVTMSDKPIGSIMVVGGGIAGIQAALDLADSGYYVYMVEKSAGIGGAMAQLDKTFPTNDCAM